MTEYYDNLETRDPDVRDAALFDELPYQIANAKDNAPHYRDLLADVEPNDITDRAALAALPVTRKSDLIELQRQKMPFGGLSTVIRGNLVRIYQSPGPIYDAEGHEHDYWRTGRAFFGAGFRPCRVIHNTFSYHFTPAGAMVDSGARAVGCAVFPAGTGNTELQIKAIQDVRPHYYAGTPSFLKILLEAAREMKADISTMKRASVAGEGLPPSLRADIKALGVETTQWYGTADVGLIAYETEAMEGLVVDEGAIVEIVRPGTGDVVADGEVGEVVVTTYAAEYPMIRFATGDLSAVMPGQSPCGRTNMRLKGWMGRADQTTKVKGMFVHPAQVAEVCKRHPEIIRSRLVVSQEKGRDVMTLQCECNGGDADAKQVAATLQAVCKLKGRVELTPPETLPNDGKVIDDTRPVE